MSYHQVPAPLQGFSDDAIKAMQASPGYFAAWYTVKSIALVAALAFIAYQAGKKRGGGT